MKNNQLIALVSVGVFILFLIYLFLSLQNKPITSTNEGQQNVPSSSITSSEQKGEAEMKKPKMQIDQNKSYTAVLETSEGLITIELNAKATPITVNNFVTLAKKNFYNNTIFHRVIKDFMIQGGDPEGTGRGGPGYRFNDEKFEGEYLRGTIAMANAGPNTNGSQFFIMHKDRPLPKDYVIFGQVIEGLDVVDKIAESPTVQDGAENSTLVTPVKVIKVTILEK